ncbi:VOC family protein [Nonomuraea sp. LPB2021202275-12-8]|uniref:VOC family protein n=1 Tax=Nonomuraea sp. LPB2021202275-12-8 TaxID=3120159 RepID=UPI00300DB99B
MQLFVNLPVKDLSRSKTFFGELGLTIFGASDDMASVVINDDTQVMLLAEATFAGYATKEVADATKSTEAILVLGAENAAQVDELAEKALAAGATPLGPPRQDAYRYQRAFADLDGHHWEVLCLVQPAG